MTESFKDAAGRERRLGGLLRQMSETLEDVRGKHTAIADALHSGEEYIPQQRIVVGQPVLEARQELGEMLEDVAAMRKEIIGIQKAHRESLAKQHPGLSGKELDARAQLGCEALLRQVEGLEHLFSEHALPREPKTVDISGVSTKRVTPQKAAGRDIN